MAEITPSQRQVLEFVTDYWTSEGIAPSLREVARGCGYRSTSGAAYVIQALLEAGFLRQTPRVARSLRVVEQP